MVQAGIEAAAGVLLGASVVAGIVAFFLPIETMGRSLPEDTDEVHELATLGRQGKQYSEGGANGHLISDTGASSLPEAEAQENPFHVSQLDAPSGQPAGELDLS